MVTGAGCFAVLVFPSSCTSGAQCSDLTAHQMSFCRLRKEPKGGVVFAEIRARARIGHADLEIGERKFASGCKTALARAHARVSVHKPFSRL